MPCHLAMTKKPVSVSPDQSVEEVLALMEKQKIDFFPVVDGDNVLQGLFSLQILFRNLLPVSVAMGGGVQIDVTVRAAPGIAKRLKTVGPLPVSDLMERKPCLVYPETPTWEGISMLEQHGSPLLVVDSESNKLVGVITARSALDELQRLRDSDT